MKQILLASLSVCAAVAQGLTEPPPLVLIHQAPGFVSVRPYTDARTSVDVVGMASITGPPTTWLLELHDSFSSIEDVDKSLRPLAPFAAVAGAEVSGADILAGSRSLIGGYRPGLSYRPEQATTALRSARYCQASIYQVQPGGESEFAELVKSRRVVFDSINLDRPDLAYHILSGASSGTYVFLAPLVSLKVLDEALARAPAYAENTAAEASKTTGLIRRYLLFRVEPTASRVSDDFASADPDFWRGAAQKP